MLSREDWGSARARARLGTTGLETSRIGSAGNTFVPSLALLIDCGLECHLGFTFELERTGSGVACELSTHLHT